LLFRTPLPAPPSGVMAREQGIECRTGLGQRKGLGDRRLELALFPPAQQLGQVAAHPRGVALGLCAPDDASAVIARLKHAFRYRLLWSNRRKRAGETIKWATTPQAGQRPENGKIHALVESKGQRCGWSSPPPRSRISMGPSRAFDPRYGGMEIVKPSNEAKGFVVLLCRCGRAPG